MATASQDEVWRAPGPHLRGEETACGADAGPSEPSRAALETSPPPLSTPWTQASFPPPPGWIPYDDVSALHQSCLLYKEDDSMFQRVTITIIFNFANLMDKI